MSPCCWRLLKRLHGLHLVSVWFCDFISVGLLMLAIFDIFEFVDLIILANVVIELFLLIFK
jgi:hypothetical protein